MAVQVKLTRPKAFVEFEMGLDVLSAEGRLVALRGEGVRATAKGSMTLEQARAAAAELRHLAGDLDGMVAQAEREGHV